ncbi:tRNA pseudouridine(55) synthase TruB, partial [Candidatus Fermentibacterales bacterium]|nr:tRNA pseudouridine(55) synthase TruB [Candidatus Fermentibacterales bacterium]
MARCWGFRKYGHAGTLDPAATGLLVVLLGRATRLSPYLTGLPKTYSFVLRLGVETDSGDSDGTVTATSGASHVDRESLETALRGFEGTFPQQVPAFSAVRVGGRRAYKLARRGQSPEMPVRQATAGSWTIEEEIPGTGFRLSVRVGTGTYVRA